MKYSIGEFSRITRITIKALHLYHEQGLLIPDFIDPESGYRYYTEEQFYDLQVIQQLKLLDFTLREIKEILDECDDEQDIIRFLDAQRVKLNRKIQYHQAAVANIETIIRKEKCTMNREERASLIEEKIVPDMLIAGHRMRCRYCDVGKGFALLGRTVGRYIKGPASCLYHDGEYKEEDADIEPFFEISKEIEKEGIDCRVLPGGRMITILSKGPYDNLHESYKIIMDAIKDEGLEVRIPSREVYIKGPGMIFKGNPENYLTEIQFMVESEEA
jgi:DNA-binding transcriptional MerR regulator/effector-binding domain-containing protein